MSPVFVVSRAVWVEPELIGTSMCALPTSVPLAT